MTTTRKLISLTLLSCILAGVTALLASCKKKQTEVLPVSLTAVVNKDTVWTTTNVITENEQNGTVYINATSPDGTEDIDLAISGFTGTRKTFTIDYRGPGGNIYGNTGAYTKGSDLVMGRSGKIVITSLSGKVMNGTFEFFYQSTTVKGYFTAAIQ